MLEKETYMKQWLENGFDSILEPVSDGSRVAPTKQHFIMKKLVVGYDKKSSKWKIVGKTSCWMSLSPKKLVSEEVPVFIHNVSGYGCHLISEKAITLVTEKKKKLTEINFKAKSSEKCMFLKIVCSKFLNSIGF